MALAQPDLAIPLRRAILANANIAGQIATYADSEAVFTRRPVPADATYPVVVISPDLTRTDLGYLSAEHLRVMRDISVYGRNDTPDHYRAVETLAYNIFDLFHRKNSSITVTGWNVVQIWGTGPKPAPDDDDMIVGRLVQLNIELIAKL